MIWGVNRPSPNQRSPREEIPPARVSSMAWKTSGYLGEEKLVCSKAVCVGAMGAKELLDLRGVCIKSGGRRLFRIFSPRNEVPRVYYKKKGIRDPQ